MAKIHFNGVAFSPIPEGRYVLKITKVTQTEDEASKDYGVIIVGMQTKDGKSHTERFPYLKYSNLDKSWEVNDKVLGRFEIFSKNALGNFSLEEIDPEDLIGCYIEVTVSHSQSEGKGKNAGKTYTNANLSDFAPASGFSGSSAPAEAPKDDLLDDDSDDEDDDFLDS